MMIDDWRMTNKGNRFAQPFEILKMIKKFHNSTIDI